MNRFVMFLVVVLVAVGCVILAEDKLKSTPETVRPFAVVCGSFIGKDAWYASPVHDSSLETTPDWGVGKVLPLMPEQAIVLAEKQFQNLKEADRDDWYVSAVRINRANRSTKWFYVICYEKISEPRRIDHMQLEIQIPVLMNGTAIIGEKEDRF